MERAEQLSVALEVAAVSVSRSDRFVIAAAQLLANTGRDLCSYEEMRDRLVSLRGAVMNNHPAREKPA